MVADDLSRLLILQDRDLRCESLRQQLAALPGDRARTQGRIDAEEARRKEGEISLKSLETKRREIEGRITAAEEQILKFKNQELQVKKNEEYTALEHEIARTREAISQAEDEGLALLELTEKAANTLEELRKSVAAEVRLQRDHLALLDRQQAQLEADLAAAQSALTEAEQQADPNALKAYHVVRHAVKRGPWIVPLEGGRCGGCHLKVSGEIDSAARKPHGPVRCDQCGRMVYIS